MPPYNGSGRRVPDPARVVRRGGRLTIGRKPAMPERIIRFACPGRPEVTLELPVLLVDGPGGVGGVEVTREQLAQLRRLEAANGDEIPLTAAEFDAVEGGDAEALARLAAAPASSLHPLFRWEEEAARRQQEPPPGPA